MKAPRPDLVDQRRQRRHGLRAVAAGIVEQHRVGVAATVRLGMIQIVSTRLTMTSAPGRDQSTGSMCSPTVM